MAADLNKEIYFKFPFQPYSIQKEFMHSLYNTLEQNKIGIFESPTGTGKSLSLICGSLTWLQNYKRRQLEEMNELLTAKNEVKSNADDDWFQAYSEEKENNDKLREVKRQYEFLKSREDKFQKLRERNIYKSHNKFEESNELEMNSNKDKCESDAEDELLEDYNSDNSNSDEDDDEDCEDIDVKIYYCSRTHSQLSQFIHEIQKSPFHDSIRVVPLGSRQTMCINDSVLKLKSLPLINECCRNMNQNKGKKTKESEDGNVIKKKKKSQKCKFYMHEKVERLSEDLLMEIQDIEQLASLGKAYNACPYYSSRRAIPFAEIVILPYNTLLHKPTRIACGIKLKGNIIIIDEAHNLMDTICNIYTAQITGNQVIQASSQVQRYRDCYKNRLSAKNLLYLNQIISLFQALLKQIEGFSSSSENKVKISEIVILSPRDFNLSSGVCDFNLFKLLTFCTQSNIARKLQGFVGKKISKKNEAQTSNTNISTVSAFLKRLSNNTSTKLLLPEENISETSEEKTAVLSVFPQIVEFLQQLNNVNKDGRIVINRKENVEESSLKYLLLNPSAEFNDIAREARSIIVAGGTMQPISEFSEQLFHKCGVPQDRLTFFSCGHIIPKDHLLPIILAKGPTNTEFEFSFKNRNSIQLIDELGRTVCNLCNIIPGGIIIFFASYEYEKQVYSQWERNNILTRLNMKKKIFREPKTANMVDQILAQYNEAIKSKLQNAKTGAILLSVVGGKMSEGINFSDDLGRCVIMVGLPYPNVMSAELKEKMNFLNFTGIKNADQKPGQLYYENLCMKAVNQSIGRAIRHKDDYATILLVDIRYNNNNVINKLPGWIKAHLQSYSTFGAAFGSINKFFVSKKKMMK